MRLANVAHILVADAYNVIYERQHFTYVINVAECLDIAMPIDNNNNFSRSTAQDYIIVAMNRIPEINCSAPFKTRDPGPYFTATPLIM